jgi:hypothetical protein
MSRFTDAERAEIIATARKNIAERELPKRKTERRRALNDDDEDALERWQRLKPQSEPPPRVAAGLVYKTIDDAQCDASSAWAEWVDARIAAAIATERQIWQKQLHDVQLETYQTMTEAFEKCSDAVMKFVDKSVSEGVMKSVATAQDLLVEFDKKVRRIFADHGGDCVFDPLRGDRSVN